MKNYQKYFFKLSKYYKNLKLGQIYAHDELDVNNWLEWDSNKYLIDNKFIKKMSKKYLNTMKNWKLDQIYAHDKLDVNNRA